MSQSTTNNTRITILERFRGPPTSGHGGYVSGRFAAFVDLNADESAEVTLRSPIPLDQSMSVLFDQDSPSNCRIQDNDTLIAEVRAVQQPLAVPNPPDWTQTLAAESRSAALMPNINPLLPGQQGFHPICFCCGPEHAEGLKIFVAPVGRQVSAIWETKTEWGDDAGNLPHAFLWTALDCPGQYAFLAEGIRTGLLGRMTAKVVTAPRAGSPLQITAWTIEIAGKKHLAGSALFDDQQTLVAYATTLWIGRQPLRL